MRHLPLLFLLCVLCGCAEPAAPAADSATGDALAIDRDAIVSAADGMLNEPPVTVTDFVAERSAGGIHDYYSEGRYWWPDEDNPDGPYVRRDGIANPQNFAGHKDALRRLAEIVTTLTAAYEITGEARYAEHAVHHLRAWFVNEATLMNPSLLYGQAIKGITTGRGIGIIDTLRLIDVALSIELLRAAGQLPPADDAGLKDWFGAYGDWLTTHEYGDDERTNNNNHSTWWGAQVAAFARAADRPDLTTIAEEQFRGQLPIQIATDGSMPDELGRTKPFHYINYNLRAWATYAELLSLDGENFWSEEFTAVLPPYTNEEGGEAAGAETVERKLSLDAAFAYALPYLDDPASWPFGSELEPTAHPHRNDFLVFAWWGLDDERYLEAWTALDEPEDSDHANLIVWQKIKQLD